MPSKVSASVSWAKAAAIAGFKGAHVHVFKARAQKWFNSQYFAPAAISGQAGKVDREGVIFLTIVAQLLGFGLSPDHAAQGALTFTDCGEFDEFNGTFAGPPGHETPVIRRARPPLPPVRREPCELYSEGQTLLVVRRGELRKFAFEVLNLLPDENLYHRLMALNAPGCGWLVIDLNALVARVDEALKKADAE